jgi:multidrug resistance efflux pump
MQPTLYETRQATEFDFPSRRLVRSSRLAARVARYLIVLLLATIVAMLFVPWQQTVSGSGSVVAYAPAERQQTIEAPVSGRVMDWDPSEIYEGARVRKGQKLCEIRDLDPDLLSRLAEQRRAIVAELEAMGNVAESYQAQVASFEEVMVQTVAAAEQYIKMAQQKVEAERQNLEAEIAAEEQYRLDYTRQKTLFADGLTSQLKLQLAERYRKEASAKVEKARASLQAAESELEAKQNERESKRREAEAKVASAQAQHRKAVGDVAKVEKSLAELDTKIAQQRNQTLLAPRDGVLLRVVVMQGGQIVKQGDPLFTLVPDTADRAAEIWISGNDVPLVSPGRHVRLQFEGWPAVQFAGWPSVAVGTFGGRVASVDVADNGQGKFRVLIVPDAEDQPWPEPQILRQGARSNGWVLLDQVTLGYELWRRTNGFPQTVSQSSADKNEAKQLKKVAKPQ